MEKTWKNWSGSLSFRPDIFKKESIADDDLKTLVGQARKHQQNIRAVGAGHSSSSLVKTSDILLSFEKHNKLLSADLGKNLAVVQPGMRIHQAAESLLQEGLSMHNTGDVNVQTVAGAIATGTHGTGETLRNLSSMLYGVKFINGLGEVIETDEIKDPNLMKALRVNLGVMGIFTEITLKLQPAFRLIRKEYHTEIEPFLSQWETLAAQNRNCDFYWYPRSDMIKVRILNLPGQGMENLPFAKLVEDREDWAMRVLPKDRDLKFDEMEYALPRKNGIACFMKIRERVKRKHREKVAWRILVRTVKADDNYLSPAFQRETMTISVHHHAGLPFHEYFTDVEPIFLEYGGRPHWGKKHFLSAAMLRTLYPEWDTFMNYRSAMDPEEVFLSSYMRNLLLGS